MTPDFAARNASPTASLATRLPHDDSLHQNSFGEKNYF
jgi:hypothetical protein